MSLIIYYYLHAAIGTIAGFIAGIVSVVLLIQMVATVQ